MILNPDLRIANDSPPLYAKLLTSAHPSWRLSLSGGRELASKMPSLAWLVLLPLLADNGELTHFGNRWGWSRTGEAFVPQLVMYATPPHFYANPAKIDRDIQTFLRDHGFNGFHVFLSCRSFDIEVDDCRKIDGRDPELDPRLFDALELLIRKTHAAGGMVHLWMWGDQQRGQTPSSRGDWGGLDGPVARKVEREVARRLGPLPGWSLGYGFDLDEWVSPAEIKSFRNRLQDLLPRFHFLGGRPGGPNRGTDHGAYRTWNRSLDYASYEHHRPSYAVYLSALEANPGKPVLSEDRFRVMSDRDSKHYTPEEVRRGLWHSTLAGGVGNIWGYLLEGGSHELGSAPFPNREAIRTHFDFIEGRFSKRMKRCSPPDAHPAETTLCLTDGPRFVLYKEDSARVELPLGALEKPEPAVAVDTRRAYREVEIGPLPPGKKVWEAPYESDWALSVGDFQRPPGPPPTTATPPPSGLRVRSSGPGRIELEWRNPSPEPGSLELERAEGAGAVPDEFETRAALEAGRTRFVDEEVSPLRTYWYRLRATGPAGASQHSENLRAFVGPEGLTISDLRPESLIPGALRPGDRYYVDRDYLLETIPPVLEGAVWIRTANDDKLVEDARFLTFVTSRPITVYVGFDPRARSLPAWLESWTPTDATIEVAGEAIRGFRVHRREFEPGPVTLGGTSAKGASFGGEGRSHYLVALVPR